MTLHESIKSAFAKTPELITEIKTLFTKFNAEVPIVAPVAVTLKEETLADGTMISYDGELAVGTLVSVKAEDGSLTPAMDGEIALMDGSTLVIVVGAVTEIKPAVVVDETLPVASPEMAATLASLETRLSAIEKENKELKEGVKTSLSAINIITSIEASTPSTPAKGWDDMSSLEKYRATKK